MEHLKCQLKYDDMKNLKYLSKLKYLYLSDIRYAEYEIDKPSENFIDYIPQSVAILYLNLTYNPLADDVIKHLPLLQEFHSNDVKLEKLVNVLISGREKVFKEKFEYSESYPHEKSFNVCIDKWSEFNRRFCVKLFS